MPENSPLSEIPETYFEAFEHVTPSSATKFSSKRAELWRFLAGVTIGLGAWYLYWRWTASLNPDAMVFSVLVAGAETLMYLGSMIFFYDIWDERDTPFIAANAAIEKGDLTPASVDILITTYNESPQVVAPSIVDAQAVEIPKGCSVEIYLLDDGNRAEMRDLAGQYGIHYLSRETNLGFKAGNLKNAILQSDGDFIAICDADTRLLPTFLMHTLGYFRDPKVAWVQTPHWFYDIPSAQPWGAGVKAAVLRVLTGQNGRGADPYLSGSTVFFDVIQRRRNRHGASFCCGAGSIHRRELLCAEALRHSAVERKVLSPVAQLLSPAAKPTQPFRFHVSEDIFTSILLHSAGQGVRSVYHPRVEARMLSPWSMDAWAAQKLKYAGGTLDILFRANPLFCRDMPWRIRLHYAATFWSYFSTPVLLIMLCAPVFALATGTAPVEAFSLAFFMHLLPFLIFNELALLVGMNGADASQGRVLSIATLPITLRAMWLTLTGRKIRFRPTPKSPVISDAIRFVLPQIAMIGVMICAALYGVLAHLLGSEDHTASLLTINIAWLLWNIAALGAPVISAFWRPGPDLIAAITQATQPKQTHMRPT